MSASTETPFTIAVPDSDLDFLKKKLDLTRFPDELEEAEWEYGAPLADVRRLAEYWRDGYDWRKHEAALNAELPQYTRDIEVDGHGSLNVHYVHKKSEVADAIPLIFVHGWPGSFIEVRKILPLLVSPGEGHQAFHVVALGLPGYGFSEAPKKKGFGPIQMAEVGHKLMVSLGYEEYVTQGGDWGSLVTRILAAKYPKHAKAWHTNMPVANPPHPVWTPFRFLAFMVTPFSKYERAGLERAMKFQELGRGYYLEQSTKPQTLGYGLADSPVGLLAWIYEKLVGWTDGYPWTDDEVLTWISIYWFSRAGPTSAARIYYEFRVQTKEITNLVVTVPTGFSYFPKEIFHPPKTWSRHLGKIVQEVQHEKGGHFAAWEVPDLLVDDLRKMFGKGGPAAGVVKVKL